jgi:hypothetical protein
MGQMTLAESKLPSNIEFAEARRSSDEVVTPKSIYVFKNIKKKYEIDHRPE